VRESEGQTKRQSANGKRQKKISVSFGRGQAMLLIFTCGLGGGEGKTNQKAKGKWQKAKGKWQEEICASFD
jgi:hypothetical protein